MTNAKLIFFGLICLSLSLVNTAVFARHKARCYLACYSSSNPSSCLGSTRHRQNIYYTSGHNDPQADCKRLRIADCPNSAKYYAIITDGYKVLDTNYCSGDPKSSICSAANHTDIRPLDASGKCYNTSTGKVSR